MRDQRCGASCGDTPTLCTLACDVTRDGVSVWRAVVRAGAGAVPCAACGVTLLLTIQRSFSRLLRCAFIIINKPRSSRHIHDKSRDPMPIDRAARGIRSARFHARLSVR